MATVESYTHHVDAEPQQPDPQPGLFYVTVIDRHGNDGTGRVGFVLGPYVDDHAAALAAVPDARRHIERGYSRACWWAYGTARLDHGSTTPQGALNDVPELEHVRPKEAR